MTLQNILICKILVVAVVLMGLFIVERLIPKASKPDFLREPNKNEALRVGKNLGLWLINSVLLPLIILPIILYASSHTLQWRGEGSFNLLIDFLLLDCWIYCWHRANHQIPFLWRFHKIHHLDQWLDVTSAVRFHFGEVLISALVRSVVIWMMDINWLSIVVFETLVLICAGFHHSNIKLPKKFEWVLSTVIVTPSIHWVHHHAIRADTDSNYATVLSVWDRLFGSSSQSRRAIDWKIGVEGSLDLPFSELVIVPFKKVKTAQ